ncbi:MAG: class I SAM-dependent methyltransferase [Pseudomonadota bacterium]
MNAAFGPVRFFSIDGAHDLEHVRNDRDVAVATLHEKGIIAFDDYCSPEWPDVTLAIFELLADESEAGFDILAVSRKKAYVCRKRYVDDYAEAIRSAPVFANGLVRSASFKGRRVPFAYESYGAIVKQKLNDQLGRGVFSAL